MIKRVAAFISFVLLAACGEVPGTAAESVCDSSPQSILDSVVEAHGGTDRWRRLTSIFMEREHLFAGTEQPIRFSIHGEYPSHRIFQVWQSPEGKFAWDGERAWSSGWPLAEQLPPRYVAGIGFYLVNMPWLVQQEAVALRGEGCSGRLPGHGDKPFLVIVADYEPDPVRKPAWFDGPRDSYELYIDPESKRLSGVMQHWTYAGRLDAAGAPASVTSISQLFVPESFASTPPIRLKATWQHTAAFSTTTSRGHSTRGGSYRKKRTRCDRTRPVPI